MPSSSAKTEDGHPVDFVLGDRHGTTCNRTFMHEIKSFLEQDGYRVALNDPYKGVELIEKFGHPGCGFNALQIEINKALYWDESTQTLHPNHKNIQQTCQKLFDFCTCFIAKQLMPKAAD